jgi:hypothetical protein
MAFHVTESPSFKFISFARQVLVRNAADCSKLSQVIIYCQAKGLLIVCHCEAAAAAAAICLLVTLCHEIASLRSQ